MKSTSGPVLAGVLFALTLVLPLAPAAAQSTNYRHRSTATTTPLDSSGTTPAQQQQIHSWRQSSGYDTQIAALGTTPVASLPMPILFGVAPSDLTPNFGDARTNHPHEGEDILAPKGTPIVSPTAAVVLKLEQGATEGNGLYTANPGGETFVYYHLDRYAEGIAAGQVLAAGTLIGYVGDTGDAAGGPAHLHFEIHSGGVPIDPFPRLTAEFTVTQKISFLLPILAHSTDQVTLARFLVTNFRDTFLAALASNISLPTPIIDALASIPAAAPRVGTGAALPAGDLDSGSTGAAVIVLQQYLIQAASGPAALQLKGAGATGTFGPLTKAALAEYQAAVGITPASGYYGPTTRAFVTAHPLTATGTTTTTTPPATTNTVPLSRDLELGSTGEDVRTLQKLLNASGYPVALTGAGSAGNETTYFGPATQAAVIKFQVAHNIVPAAGYVGPITRAAL